MSYTARVVETQVQNGQLAVLLEYSNGAQTFRDKMTSRGGQAGDWVEREVERRLAELDGLDTLATKIQPGEVKPKKKDEPQPQDSGRAAYEAKLREFEAWLQALRQGVVTVERPAFVALKDWLRANWRDEYIELFLR